MKKLGIIALLLIMILPAAFAGGQTESKTSGYEVAMITDIGDIDDKSFNQGTWEGIVKFAEDNDLTHKYYKPTEKTTDAYVAAIDLAITGGAKIVVCPGYLFEPAIYRAQDLYPDTSFILIDGTPHTEDYSTFRIESNVYSIFYAEQESGFLAGYAAVKDGYTKLGFMGGMAVPAVVRYGYGFVQGAEKAASEMGLGSVELMYTYTGNFDATPENQAMAASWYGSGTEVIFACGGKVGNSVMAAAEANNGKVIGVDVDQSAESATVITSAMKQLGVSVYLGLEEYYAGNFKGGVSETLDATVDAVGLPIDNSKFKKFSKADYEKLFTALVNDTNGLRTSILGDGAGDSPNALPLSIVSVTVVQ